MYSICMVGTGAIAAQHMKSFAELGHVRPRCVVSRTEEEAQAFAQKWNFDRVNIALDEALDDPQINLVVIASPSELHAEQTIRALQAGKDVIVEIPVAMSLADAERIAELAVKLRRRALVCQTMRSFPAVAEVRRRVLEKELHLTHIAGYFAIPRRRNQGMGGLQRNWIDNLLWHHGCHMVDVGIWVLGATRVERVNALFGRPHREFGMVMDLSIHFCAGDKQLVSNALTYNTEEFCWEVRFIGDEATLTYRNGQLLNDKGEPIMAASSWVDLASQNQQILDSITRQEPSDFDITTVITPMTVLHEAELSAAYRETRGDQQGERIWS